MLAEHVVAWWNPFRRRRTAGSDPPPAWVVAGLGNPGPDYLMSRHNFGFMAADRLVRHCGGRWSTAAGSTLQRCRVRIGEDVPLEVIRPLEFMNRSGGAVRRVLASYGLDSSRLIVLVDDLALPLGSLRIRQGGGDGGHNGLRSVVQVLADGAFTRVRLGVAPQAGMPPAAEWVDFVLGSFEPDEEEVVRRVAGLAVEAVADIVGHGPLKAMSRYNRRK